MKYLKTFNKNSGIRFDESYPFKRFLFIILIFFLSLNSCDQNDLWDEASAQKTPTTIAISENSLNLSIGKSENLEVSFSPDDASNSAVRWETSDSSVVTVTEDGVVTALLEGTAAVSVISDENSISASCTVTVVPVGVSAITLDKSSLQLDLSATDTISATLTPSITPSNATVQTVAWSSSDGSVVSVSTDGTVRAVNPGSATVTVTTDEGGHSAGCDITVIASVTGVSLSSTTLTVGEEYSETLDATISPSNATNSAVTWSSSNTSVATVSSGGVVTGVAAGTATVTVTSVDGSYTDTCTVTVEPTYTLTYDGNSNDGGSVPSAGGPYFAGSTFTVEGNPNSLTHSTDSFIGWNTADDGSGTNYTQGETYTVGSSDIVLYANWSSATVYSITYNGNGNDSGSVPVDTTSYLSGSTFYALKNLGGLSQIFYPFDAWNSAADGSGTAYAAGSSATITADFTLYAQYALDAQELTPGSSVSAVAISGNFMVIGSSADEAAYVYYRSSGVWGLSKTLSTSESGDGFGSSVAIDGDYILIGAPANDSSGYTDAGAVYVFEYSSSTWPQSALLVSQNPESGGAFGSAVDISGEYAAVGAYLESPDGYTESGSGYVFYRNGGTWDSYQQFSNSTAADHFGESIAIDGSNLVIGSKEHNGGYGIAYIYALSETNSWTLSQTITSDTDTDKSADYFASSIDIYGNYIVVGVPLHDHDSLIDTGAAFVFLYDTGTTSWGSMTRLVEPTSNAGDEFGGDVAINRSYIVAGASGYSGSYVYEGCAYVFKNASSNSWSDYYTIEPYTEQVNGFFGSTVDLSGSEVIIGASGISAAYPYGSMY